MNVRALAAEKGITIWDVEKNAGLSRGYLSRTQTDLGIERVNRLAAYFGVTLDELVNGGSWKQNLRSAAIKALQEAVETASMCMTGDEIRREVEALLEKFSEKE